MGKVKKREADKGCSEARKRRTRPKLSAKERAVLSEFTTRGRAAAREFKRARILELIDDGLAMQDIAIAVGVGEATVRRVRRRYEEGGLERALKESPRPGAQRRLSPKQEQRVVAMVCGPPPKGYARWTVRLITEEVIQRGIAPEVGRETIRVLLQNHELKPWREKNVERARTQRRVH